MLKKIIIGFLCFVILAVTGIGIYIYMLDWNQHKELVAERFSEITGLKADIDGDLRVEIFPTPTFTANSVRFSKKNSPRNSLIDVNEISANVDLMGLIKQKFIVHSMTLVGATVNIHISDKGELNWSGVGNNSTSSSGNIEVSFNDIRLSASTVHYQNEQEKTQFEVSGIASSISAATLRGPYQVNGHFAYNNSEIKFNGSIRKDKDIVLKLTIENASTKSKSSIDGTLGTQAKGLFTFDTAHLSDVSAVILGDGALSEHYNDTFFNSFQYDYNAGELKLNNFNIAYGNTIKGVGDVNLSLSNEQNVAVVNLDMVQFNLDVLENIIKDTLSFVEKGGKFSDTKLSKQNVSLSLKSPKGVYKGVEAENINIAMELKNSNLALNRFFVDFLNDSNINVSGNIEFTDDLLYTLDTSFKTNNLRAFASILHIDLAKLASENDKNTIFRKALISANIKGNSNSITFSVPKFSVDTTDLNGNLAFIRKDEKNFVIADINATKILFDKYVNLLPSDLANASFQDKLVYQLNLLPWSHETDADIRLQINSAVYNKVPLENVLLEAHLVDDNAQIKKLSIDNFGGANLDVTANAKQIYSTPYFNELSYNIKTANFPAFITTLDISTDDKKLFQRKIFASQGALSGYINDFNISSIQKLGDLEFAYTGVVNSKNERPIVDGNLELKTNNFTNFIHGLNIDYTPDMPITSFSLSGKLKGSSDLFEIKDINAHLGANHISGNLQADLTSSLPKFVSSLNFDKFDADRFFNLNKKKLFPLANQDKSSFIGRPLFSDEKIDYSLLKQVEFNIQAKSNQLTYRNKSYGRTEISTALVNGILNVSDFQTEHNDTNIQLSFILNSGNMPKIQGTYALKGVSLPFLGGTTYVLEGGFFNADGSFESLAISQKDFIENLSSRGKFSLLGTALQGWDLDLIKFELEQRQSSQGFEESILKDLSSGRSIFNKISGKYDITKALLTADNIVWESPVANLNMRFDLNLSTWLFHAVFNTRYHNASFPDILKFTFEQNLAQPKVTVDLKESLVRIKESETELIEAKNKKHQELREKLSGKIKELQREVELLSKTVSRFVIDVVRYKPVTENATITQTYASNLEFLQTTEDDLKRINRVLQDFPSEEKLMALNIEVANLKSKLNTVPRSLEDNYIVDSKYVFDETFNKIAWVYNVANNNFSYYITLTEAYIGQLNLLDGTEQAISEENRQRLTDSVQAVTDDMEKIKALHNKIRENYLAIIDTTRLSEMKENNKIAFQALDTIFSSANRMNNKIVESIDEFRGVLNLSSRDYDHFMVYLPATVNEVDITKPTVRTENDEIITTESVEKNPKDKVPSLIEKNTNAIDDVETSEKEKKKTDMILSSSLGEGLSGIWASVQNPTNTDSESIIESVEDSSLLNAIHPIIVASSGANDIVDQSLKDNVDFFDLSTPTKHSDRYEANELLVKASSPTDLNKDLIKTALIDFSVDSLPVVEQQEEILVSASNDVFSVDSLPVVEQQEEILVSASNDVSSVDSLPVVEQQEESPVSTNNDAEVTPVEAENSNNSFLSYAKSAIKNIISGVKHTEQSIQEFVSQKTDDVNSQVLTEEDSNLLQTPKSDEKKKIANIPPVLKTNPVIALDLDKDDYPKAEEEIISRSKKTGFKNKTSKQPSEKKENDSQIVNAKNSKQDNLPAYSKEKFLTLLADEKHDTTSYNQDKNTNIVITSVPQEESADDINGNNLYLFSPASVQPVFRGSVGKTLNKPSKVVLEVKPTQHYLFALNDKSNHFFGKIHKRPSLYVK